MKKCPRCRRSVANSLAACPSCHLLFEQKQDEPAKPAVKRAEKKREAPQTFTRLFGLRIPDGPNPVPLKGRDKTSLLNWAGAVRQYWLNKGCWLAVDGLCYYLQWEPQFDDHPKLFEAACKILQDNLTDDKPEPQKP